MQQLSFEEFITPFFENETTRVYDTFGNDITQEFFSVNTSNYLSGHFEAIKEYSYEHVGRFKAYKEKVVASNRMNQTRYIETWDAPYVRYSGTIMHASGYVKTTIGGNYVYNPNSGEIVSAYSPVVKRIEFEDFVGWSMSYGNLTTRASVSSDKFNAIFSATMTVYGSYTEKGQIFDANMGAVTASVRGDASGVLD